MFICTCSISFTVRMQIQAVFPMLMPVIQSGALLIFSDSTGKKKINGARF